jgi:catechol 2,3-dioxygenase-like lactoylglutathione lyase family enzyme
MIRGLHHNAYRCRNSEETRRFYEGFLGLTLAGTLEITETKTGRAADVLHTFYQLGDGSYLAFFEAPEMAFTFKTCISRWKSRPRHSNRCGRRGLPPASRPVGFLTTASSARFISAIRMVT